MKNKIISREVNNQGTRKKWHHHAGVSFGMPHILSVPLLGGDARLLSRLEPKNSRRLFVSPSNPLIPFRVTSRSQPNDLNKRGMTVWFSGGLRLTASTLIASLEVEYLNFSQSIRLLTLANLYSQRISREKRKAPLLIEREKKVGNGIREDWENSGIAC